MDPETASLLDGDPTIGWQTQRDLLDEPEPVWTAEPDWDIDFSRTTKHSEICITDILTAKHSIGLAMHPGTRTLRDSHRPRNLSVRDHPRPRCRDYPHRKRRGLPRGPEPHVSQLSSYRADCGPSGHWAPQACWPPTC